MVDNPGIVALKTTLEFDESVFELKGVTNKMAFESYEDSKETDDGGNIVFESPYQMFWSSPQATQNNTHNGDVISFEFEVKDTKDLSNQIIKFNFVEAFDKDGNPVGGVSSKFAVDVCEVKVGDVDGSDRVNIWDAVLLRQHYFDGSDAKLLMDASDTNYDGNKTSVDSTYLNRYVVGLYGYYDADGTPGRYKVNFKGNGFEEFTQTMTVGDELPVPPVADSSLFHGWYDNPGFTGKALTKLPIRTGGKINLSAGPHELQVQTTKTAEKTQFVHKVALDYAKLTKSEDIITVGDDGYVTITANYTTPVTGTLYFAFYNEGKLILATNAGYAENLTTVTGEEQGPSVDYDYVKMFVWGAEIAPQNMAIGFAQ